MRCRNCGRPAGFLPKGKKANKRWHGNKHHDLCGRCYRDARNAAIAKSAAKLTTSIETRENDHQQDGRTTR